MNEKEVADIINESDNFINNANVFMINQSYITFGIWAQVNDGLVEEIGRD